jgi:hypothetical protein
MLKRTIRDIAIRIASSANGGLINLHVGSEGRARAAAWAQASNLGGGAIGPGLILYLALHLRASIYGPHRGDRNRSPGNGRPVARGTAPPQESKFPCASPPSSS